MTLKPESDSIQSERLSLRRIKASDLEFLVRIHSDPEIARFIGHGRPRSRDESTDWLHWVLTSYDESGLGQLMVARKSDGCLLGRCGLSELFIETAAMAQTAPRAWFSSQQIPSDCAVSRFSELGYAFDSAYWGQGYATEAVRLIADYVHSALRPSNVVSLIHPDNTRSLRLARRFGLTRQRSVECFDRILDQYQWPDGGWFFGDEGSPLKNERNPLA